jgi:membrane protein
VESGRTSLGPEPIPRPVRSLLLRARAALFDVDEQSLSPFYRTLVLVGRAIWLVLRSFFRDRLQMRAASLSFSTLLASVPALALCFAVAKATGLFAVIRDETILPFIDETLGPAAAAASPGVMGLRTTAISLVSLVEGTSMTGLGVTGLVVLLLAILRVVRGVDESFRHVFEHRGPRKPPLRRIRAFVIVALVTPLGLAYAVTSASLSHGHAAALVSRWITLPMLHDGLVFVLPPLVVMLTLYVLYVELPDAPVQRSSAMFGAFGAGLAWYGAQLLHVHFQVGLARWNAIYSGFGAFPVLLASVQISWVIVLVGAQLVAMHQHSPTLRVLAGGARRDFASLSLLGMQAAVALAGHGAPVTARTLAAELKSDLVSMRLVLDALAARGIVSAVEASAGKHYVLTADPAALKTSDVLDAIEKDPHADLPWNDGDPVVRDALRQHRRAADLSEHNLTIAELRARTRSA